MVAAPVRYSPNVEDVKPDEARTIQHLRETFDTIIETTAKDYGHAVRSVHAKSHGILEGTLTIDDGLAPELAQGLFVFVRISTNARSMSRGRMSEAGLLTVTPARHYR